MRDLWCLPLVVIHQSFCSLNETKPFFIWAFQSLSVISYFACSSLSVPTHRILLCCRSGREHQPRRRQQLTSPAKPPSPSTAHSLPSRSHLAPFPVARSVTLHRVTLRAPALHHPNTILVWKCKPGQQQRLRLAGSWERNPSSFASLRHPLR